MNILIKAEQKYVRMSPRKLREVVDAIRKVSSPSRAIDLLEVVDRRAASPVRKVILAAVSNATKNMSLSPDTLKISEMQVTEGPIYKRWRPVSRGRAHAIQKRTSHIRVVLEAQEPRKITKSPPSPKKADVLPSARAERRSEKTKESKKKEK